MSLYDTCRLDTIDDSYGRIGQLYKIQAIALAVRPLIDHSIAVVAYTVSSFLLAERLPVQLSKRYCLSTARYPDVCPLHNALFLNPTLNCNNELPHASGSFHPRDTRRLT